MGGARERAAGDKAHPWKTLLPRNVVKLITDAELIHDNDIRRCSYRDYELFEKYVKRIYGRGQRKVLGS